MFDVITSVLLVIATFTLAIVMIGFAGRNLRKLKRGE